MKENHKPAEDITQRALVDDRPVAQTTPTTVSTPAARATPQYAQVMKKTKASSDDDEGLTVVDNALYGSREEENKFGSADYEMARPVDDDNDNYDLTVVDNVVYGQRSSEDM